MENSPRTLVTSSFFVKRRDLLPSFVQTSADPPTLLGFGEMGVVDVDGDGQFELLVSVPSAPNVVLGFRRGGSMVEQLGAGPCLENAPGLGAGFGIGDMDGDGLEEVLVMNGGVFTGMFPGRVALTDRLCTRSPRDPEGASSEAGPHPPSPFSWRDVFDNAFTHDPNTASKSCLTFDRRGGGQASLLVAQFGLPLRLYEVAAPAPAGQPGVRFGARGDLSDVSQAAGLDASIRRNARATACLNLSPEPGTGRSGCGDIFVAVEGGANMVLTVGADGTLKESGAEPSLALVVDKDGAGRAAAPVNCGGDRLCLVIANYNTPSRMIAFPSHDSGRRSVVDHAAADASASGPDSPGGALGSAPYTAVAVADFDNDGYDEVFLHANGRPNRLFRVLDTGEIIPLGLGAEAADPEGKSSSAMALDVDGDGVLELVLTRPGGAGMSCFSVARDVAEGNAWVRVRPVLPSGAPARGVSVSLSTRSPSGVTRRMQRNIDSVGMPSAHFGLGKWYGGSILCNIFWSDGSVDTFHIEPSDLSTEMKVVKRKT